MDDATPGAPAEPIDLAALGDELMAEAAGAASGRATRVLRARPGGSLSQVMLALDAGRELSEHENPGQALLEIRRGRVRLVAGEVAWELGTGEHVVIPDRRHSLLALEDALVTLTVVRGG